MDGNEKKTMEEKTEQIEETSIATEKKEERTSKKGLLNKADNFWKISSKGSSFKIEIFAGIATFLAMAYILTVNPDQILYGGVNDPRWASIYIATAFGAIIGTLLMAFIAKMPFAQAPGMGLNTMIGGVIGAGVALYGVKYSFGNAMLLVLISGIIFLLLSVIPGGRDKKTGRSVSLREKIFDGMPKSVRLSIPVGIGLFIAFIGMQNAGIIIANQYTLVQFVDIRAAVQGVDGAWEAVAPAIVAIFGLITIAVLSHYKVKGAIVIGVLLTSILAIPLGVANVDILLGKADGISWKFWENFKSFFSFNPEEGGVFFAAFTEGFDFPSGALMSSIMLIVTFCMLDMFDTMGTVVGCATNAGLVDEDGKPLNYDKIMLVDSTSTVIGSLLGTSTVTTFVESGTGIAVGGRTGMTSFTTACFFFLAIFLLPVFAFIPSAAAASALIYVGVLMIGNVKNIDFSNVKNSVSAFLTIIMMVLCYSITDGIGIGVLAYVLISIAIYIVDMIKYALSKDEKKVKPQIGITIVTVIVALLFIVYFIVPRVL